MRLYLDAAIVIYAVEAITPYDEMVRARLTRPGVERVVSELTRLEVRVKPLRNADSALVAAFDRYLDGVCEEMVALSRGVLERAAELRAKYAFLKTPDAIHLAAAIEAGCDAFFTNDHRLERCAGRSPWRSSRCSRRPPPGRAPGLGWRVGHPRLHSPPAPYARRRADRHHPTPHRRPRRPRALRAVAHRVPARRRGAHGVV